jgi:hypothetical protein
MKLKAKVNLDECFAQLDRFVDAVQSVATVRAINKLTDQAETAGFRKISELYQLGPRTMEQYAAVRLASAGNVEASIVVKGRGFPLSQFAPIRTRAGISVRIKGKRFTIPHSFFIRGAGEHVFARGGYSGKGGIPTGEKFGRFAFGKRRLPIQELFTFGPVEAFTNEEVTSAMQDRVEEQAASVLGHEIKFAARGV